MKLYMIRAFSLPIIRSLFTVHSTLVYIIQVCRQLSNRTRMEHIFILVLLESCPQNCMTYTSAECTGNKLLMPETCRVSSQNEFGKLVNLVGFIIKKFVTMRGHMNVKFNQTNQVDDLTRNILKA
jgi:hypothetical protein